MRNDVRALLGVDPDKVVVIPNGVDVDEIRQAIDPRVRSRLVERWPLLGREGALKGISVGRLEANKGFEYLLRALSAIRLSLGEEWLWLLVGDGSLRGQLEALSGVLDLGGHVVFAGQVSDSELHNLYSLATIFGHPTLYEGSSLVTLEAMAHRLPVVASAVGGIPDKVIEGETGFLVPPADPGALGDRITWVAAHPQRGREMGMKGERLAEGRFGWARIAAQTEELFVTLINERAACKAMEAQSGR